jgi:1,2-dihydroxy-3-keto-5-methylthiopentene dioxygenase
MVKLWYFNDNLNEDQRRPHYSLDENKNPVLLPVEHLKGINVQYKNIDVDNIDYEKELINFCESNGYKNKDQLTITEKMPNYDEKIKMFFEEHIHEDDEIRFILDGKGYFDVRDGNDCWIRIEVEKNDLLVLPAGIYHRFTLDIDNYIKVIRIFHDVPKWIPINRPCEENDVRREYLRKIKGN